MDSPALRPTRGRPASPSGGLGRLLGLVCLVVAVLASARPASAQTEGFALDRFDPSERGSDFFVLESLDLRGHLRPAVGIIADWGYKPLVVYNDDGSERAAVIEHQLYLHVGGSFVMWDRVRFAANLPIAAYLAGEPTTVNGTAVSADEGQAIGDLRLGGDVRVFGEYGDVITGAAGLQLYLPTGSRTAFTGDGSVRVQPRAMVSGRVSDFEYSARLGVQYRAQSGALDGTDFGSEMTWGAAAGLRAADDKLIIGPELYGTTTFAEPFARRSTPAEVILGAHYDVAKDWRIGAGVGPGLTRGLGAPEVRIVASIEWVPGVEEKPKALPSDRDGDGILDEDDACPDTPGEANDDPEKNGCPPGDRDGDGILDDDDACPDTPGEANDDPEKNGCPPGDRDGDKIIDDDDACPDEKGVRDDDPEKNGCPPPKDTDGDGILDEDDACVNTPGPKNADREKHGCPVARVEKGQIRILEQVQFATNSDRILSESDELLQAVYEILDSHTEITKVDVEGHTDNRGAPAYNKGLSQRRARSVVKWLAAHGIAPSRLSSHGFGLERPIADNDTDSGRSKNRRVEFHIREIDGKAVDAASVEE